MIEGAPYARLLNGEGEMIAEGPCQVDERAGMATLEPVRDSGEIRTARGNLALELDSGRSLRVSQRPLVVRVRMAPPQTGRRTMYRLRLARDARTNDTQDARAAGGAGEGTPAQPAREAPAAHALETEGPNAGP